MFFRFQEEFYIPTTEDKLDVNFRSIVSTLRHIVYGGLTPRPWSDISSTWYDKPEEVKPRNSKLVVEGPQKRKPTLGLNRKSKTQFKRELNVLKLTRILMSNGMDESEAFVKASVLLQD